MEQKGPGGLMMVKIISSSFPSNAVTERDLVQTDFRLDQRDRIKLTHHAIYDIVKLIISIKPILMGLWALFVHRDHFGSLQVPWSRALIEEFA